MPDIAASLEVQKTADAEKIPVEHSVASSVPQPLTPSGPPAVKHASAPAAAPSEGRGLTSRVVGENIARIRARDGLSNREVAERVVALGVPMSTSGISDICRGARSVSVDQLIAIAAALDVGIIALLIPNSTSPTGDSEPASLTAVSTDLGWQMLEWLRGEGPLNDWGTDDPQEELARESFRRRSLPPWAWTRPNT